MPMVCELLNVRETLRYRDLEPTVRRPRPVVEPEMESWAAGRVAELAHAGVAGRVVRPRGQGPVVVYRIGRC